MKYVLTLKGKKLKRVARNMFKYSEQIMSIVGDNKVSEEEIAKKLKTSKSEAKMVIDTMKDMGLVRKS